MHDLGNFVLNLAMVIAAAWIVNQFWRSFFQKKEKSFLSVTVWILYCIFQILRQCNRGNINLPGTFIHILLILMIAIFRSIGNEPGESWMISRRPWMNWQTEPKS